MGKVLINSCILLFNCLVRQRERRTGKKREKKKGRKWTSGETCSFNAHRFHSKQTNKQSKKQTTKPTALSLNIQYVSFQNLEEFWNALENSYV